MPSSHQYIVDIYTAHSQIPDTQTTGDWRATCSIASMHLLEQSARRRRDYSAVFQNLQWATRGEAGAERPPATESGVTMEDFSQVFESSSSQCVPVIDRKPRPRQKSWHRVPSSSSSSSPPFSFPITRLVFLRASHDVLQYPLSPCVLTVDPSHLLATSSFILLRETDIPTTISPA